MPLSSLREAALAAVRAFARFALFLDVGDGRLRLGEFVPRGA